jgi:hypothetical protein
MSSGQVDDRCRSRFQRKEKTSSEQRGWKKKKMAINKILNIKEVMSGKENRSIWSV